MQRGRDPRIGACEVEVGGERLVLLRERAVWRPECGDLLVADVHLGKGATFRRAGIGVPTGATQHDLDALFSLVAGVEPVRLVVLGDLWHTSTEVGTATGVAIGAGLERLRDLGVDVLLIEGNHDRRAGRVDVGWPLEVACGRVQAGGFTYAHEPQGEDDGALCPTLAGHVHPSVKIRTGRDSMRLPAFWLRGETLVLPAFGAFTGGYPVEHLPRRALWVATPDGVVPWGARA